MQIRYRPLRNRRARTQIAALCSSEVHRVLSGSAGVLAPFNAHEALGACVSEALPAAVETWQPLMTSMDVTIHAVGAFSIFGTPHVLFQDRSGRERCSPLGDLLIIVEDVRTIPGKGGRCSSGLMVTAMQPRKTCHSRPKRPMGPVPIRAQSRGRAAIRKIEGRAKITLTPGVLGRLSQ